MKWNIKACNVLFAGKKKKKKQHECTKNIKIEAFKMY